MTALNPNIHDVHQLGEPMPDFSLLQLDGAANQGPASLLDGKLGLLVVFWSAICSHCQRYDQYFNSFLQIHPSLGLVAVASRLGETKGQIRSATIQRRLLFPILIDETGDVARSWHSQQTPRCYLVNGERRLIYRGAVDNFKHPKDPDFVAYLEPAVQAFLKGEPVARAETASFGCAIDTVYYQLPKYL